MRPQIMLTLLTQTPAFVLATEVKTMAIRRGPADLRQPVACSHPRARERDGTKCSRSS